MKESKILFLIIFVSFLFSDHSSRAQCCATGSPVGASVNVGVLTKKNLRVIAFYRNSYSDTYYSSDHKTEENTALSNAYYNFTGLTFGYGLTKRLTLEADFGYFFNKTQNYRTIDYTETGHGLSNGGVTLKYGLFIRPLKQIEISGGLGFRYPFSLEPQMQDGHTLNPDVQPSTHAFGASGILFLNKGFPEITLRLFSINKYDYNFVDKNGYKYGNILMNSIFGSKKIMKNLFGILQVRSEFKSRDVTKEGNDREDSGYLLLTLTPQISYSVAGHWNVSVLYDIPVYKNYNGKQLTPSYSFAVSLSHDFNLGPKLR